MPHLILQDVPSSVEPYDVIACHTDDALTAKLRKTWDAQRVAQVGRYTFIELADPGVAEAANAAMYNSSTCTITAAVVKDQALWDECWGVLRTHRAGDASDEPVSTAATRLVAAAAPCTSAPMSGYGRDASGSRGLGRRGNAPPGSFGAAFMANRKRSK